MLERNYVGIYRLTFILLSGSFISSFAAQQIPATPNVTVMVPAPMVTLSCSTCSTFASLKSTAQTYFASHNGAAAPGFPVIPSPLGNITYVIRSGITKAIVVSQAYALSANFTLAATPTPISTTTDIGAYNFDGVAFARAPKLPPIYLPPGITTGETDENIIQVVQTILVPNGGTGISWLNMLMNLGQVVYYKLTDTQTGLSYQVFVGDTITVRYADGSTEKFQFLGPEAGTVMFKRVPDSYRNKDGSKPTVPNSTSPAASGASISVIGGGGDSELVLPIVDTSLPRGQVTVGDPIDPATANEVDPNGPINVNFDDNGWFGTCGC